MAAANLERLDVQAKIDLGRLLLETLSPKKARPQYLWALSRIGAREPLYGPIDRVVPQEEASEWIKTIMSWTWKNPKSVGPALAHMARLTGDRKRDLSPTVLEKIDDWLRPHDWSEPHIRLLKEVVPIAPQEENRIFGESLPSGLFLAKDHQGEISSP
jgi:hypothetical protein